MSLSEEYSDLCRKYVSRFSEKQNCDIEEIEEGILYKAGGFLLLSFNDIKTDIDKEVLEGSIFTWIEEDMINGEQLGHIDYESYILGLRYSMLEENLHK